MVKARPYGSSSVDRTQVDSFTHKGPVTHRNFYCTGTHHLMHTEVTQDSDHGPVISSRFELKGPCDGFCGNTEIDIGHKLEETLKAVPTAV